MLRDGAWSGGAFASSTFRADVAAGTYQVTVTLGDAWYARDRMQVKANGVVVTPAGRREHGRGPVRGGVVCGRGGAGSPSVQLEFSDLGGDPYWTANAVTIRSAVTAGTLNVSNSSLVADGTTVDTFTQSGLVPAGLYTVTATLGTVLTTGRGRAVRGDPSAGHGGLGQRGRDAELPGAAAAGGGDGNALTADQVTGKAQSTGSATYTLAPVRRFDFNGPSNDTGWRRFVVGVRGSTTYSASLGYGWNAAVPEFERGSASSATLKAMYRDGAYGTVGAARTFQVQVDATKSYYVRVYVGDSYARDNIRVTLSDNTTPQTLVVPNTAGSVFVTASNKLGTPVTNGTVGTGVLSITVSDLGGDYYWVINGVDVWESGTGTDPNPRLAAAGRRTGVRRQGPGLRGRRTKDEGRRTKDKRRKSGCGGDGIFVLRTSAFVL